MAFAYRSQTFLNRPATSYIGESSDIVRIPHVECETITATGGVITSDDITTTGRVTGATMTCTTAPATANDVVRLTDISAILPSTPTTISPIMYLFNDQTSTIDPGIMTNITFSFVRTNLYVECTKIGRSVIGSPFVLAGDYHLCPVTGPAPYTPTIVVPDGWRPAADCYLPISIQCNQIGHVIGTLHITTSGELHIGAYNSVSDSLNFTNVTYITVEPFAVKYYSLAP